MDLQTIEAGFVAAGIPANIVEELTASYQEAKRRFHLGDHRPQEVEGGRFSEAAFRILQHLSGLPVTPVGKTLPSVDKLLPLFESVTNTPDSVRLHIPRTLKLIYDIRNKRDAAHLGDGIDPNLQDATLVVSNMDWVLAELVRLHHGVSADEAERIIEDVVTKEVPAVQEINGQPVILSDLQPRDQALLMLYRAGGAGATLDALAGWLRVDRKDHLKSRLAKLDLDKFVLLHPQDGRYYLTSKGTKYIEQKRLAQPA